jgi:AmmeMemoRadiSam system protein B/AmmeMemoRadiSam system protein A
MSRRFPGISSFLPFLAVLLLVLLAATQSIAQQGTSGRIHDPVCAGTWYPGNPADLKDAVRNYLSHATTRAVNGEIVALVSPHAGYIYSGQVAACSYKLLQGRHYDSVIVIGPSHRVPFSGVATYDCAGFRTPIDVIPLDSSLISSIMKREPRIRSFPEAFQQEHSIEMQLPFLHVVLPGFKLVPLVMGDSDLATCRWLADAIADSIKGKSVLVVASSDLSHYHSYDTATEMDHRLLDKVSAMNTDDLSECLNNGKCEACGRGPVMTAMLVAKRLGSARCDVVHYANSGDVTGDKSSPRGVVGYAAACFSVALHDKDRSDSEKRKCGIDIGLSESERTELHAIAKSSIEACCRGTSAPKVETVSQKLKEQRGVFVTITKKGNLRGCIGQIIGRVPLAEAVSQMAEAAALRDPRFSPLRAEELPDINIEISVLTPLRKIDSTDEIEVGTHGIVMRNGMNMGLLLPQVATEYGWSRTEFLENTCQKAGLPKNAWKDKDTEIYIFSADVF